MKYVIIGKCNGVPYYLKLEERGRFTWMGIQNNATHFLNEEMAKVVIKKFDSESKLPMEIIPVLEKIKH